MSRVTFSRHNSRTDLAETDTVTPAFAPKREALGIGVCDLKSGGEEMRVGEQTTDCQLLAYDSRAFAALDQQPTDSP